MTKLQTDAKFRIFYTVLVYVAAVAVITPGIFLFLRSAVTVPGWLVPLIIFFFIAVGWLLQSLYANITKHKRAEVTYEYETNEQSFKSSQAAVPLIAAAIIALVIRALTDSLMYRAYEAGYLANYDEFSVVPYAVMIIVFIIMLIGIVMWFYSVERFGTIKFFFPCLAVITIEYILSLYGGGSTVNVCTACLCVFLVCAVVIMNQTFIMRTFRGSVVSVITPRSRLFNILIVLLMCAAVLLVMGLMTLALYGLFTLVKMLFFMIMYNADLDAEYSGGDRYYDEAELESSFANIVYGSRSQAQSGQYFFVMFALVFVVFMLFMIFRRTNFVKNLIERIKQWIEDMIAFLDNARYFNSVHTEKHSDVVSYKDEEKKLQDAEISEYNAAVPSAKSYRDFQSKLSRMKTVDEKVTFAYVTLIGLYRKMNMRLMPSFTPREIARTVNSNTDAGSPIGEITEVIETIKYAEEEPESVKTQTALENMCAVIKKYMY